MAAPYWITPPGDLGTIVEQEFYQVQLNAGNADYYEHISGKLPNGIRITPFGKCEGYPNAKDYIQGVPVEVAFNVTSRFVVRATNTTEGTVADRVFELTVTGNDAPTIDSLPPTDLGAAWDGSYFEKQLTASDPDPGDVTTWRLQSGNLPPGLSISTRGLISGYIRPAPTLTGTPGYDVNNFDIGTFDFSTVAESKTYEWVVEASDGKDVAIKNYTLFVASRNAATADTDVLTADSFKDTANTSTLDSLVDAATSTERPPAILTKPTDFGTIKHDNFFATQFKAYDPDGDTVEFTISVGDATGFDATNFDMDLFDRGDQALPPGLVMDTQTGWLSGYIPIINVTTRNYSFAVRCYKKDKPTIVSEWVFFTLTIEGDTDKAITWPAANLGTIRTGDVSEIDIRATVRSGKPVQYELRSGALANTPSNDKLPQGLRVTNDGFIQGRVSFEHMMFDNGRTTFDVEMYNKGEFADWTTFEHKYTFTIRAFSADGVIDTYNTFNIEIKPETTDPYETLYIRALPKKAQRDIYNNLINNSDDIPVEDIYRPTDFYFGLQRDIRALIATGLAPKTASDYVQATAKNHFNNTLAFGDIKVATSYDANNVAKYDIVYIELIDSAMGIDPSSKNPAPASNTINLQLQKSITNMADFIKPITADAGFPKTSTGNQHADQGNEIEVYPNAIQNMRNRMKDSIGSTILERFVLPDWMQDKQTNGEVLGWTLAAPIVYMKPGTGLRTAFRLKQRTEFDLKNISFEVDRFILDNNLSNFYNKQNQKFLATAETTFDRSDIGSSVVATVDYSVDGDCRFDSLNKKLASEVVASGCINGVTDVTELNGKTVIWLRHEGITDPDNDNDGWIEQLDVYDQIGYDYETSGAGSSLDPEYNNGAIIDVTGNGSDFFKRELTVNGVRIMGAGTVGGQTAVPDAWLEKVGRMYELFLDPNGAGINESFQRAMIKTLSGDAGTYHAGLPTLQRVARGAGADYTPNFLTDAGIISWNLTDLFNTHVHNDMVWYLNSTGSGYGVGETDAQEVIEHVFHTLHMHGLDAQSLKMYPSISADWATGPLYNAMVEAYDGGFWDSSGYGGANFKTDPDAFEVAAKEYLYLLNFCMFDYSDLWDGDSLAPEWSDTVKTPAGIQANLPLGYALYNTYIAPVISKPSLATIRNIFQDGNTPAQDDPSLAGASGYIVDVISSGGVVGAGRYDGGQQISGYVDKLLGNATVNKQAGVWTISVNSANIVTFTFTREILNGDQVKVTYDNIIYYYERSAVGRAPQYVNVKDIDLSSAGVQSVFDGNGTRFFKDIDKWTNGLDTNDAWIKFPRVNAFRDNIQR